MQDCRAVRSTEKPVGFTLIEVLVAVSLMAVAVIAVLKTSMQNQDALLASDRATTASLLAAEKMSRLHATPELRREARGEFEDPHSLFSWETRTGSDLDSGLQRVEVIVNYQGNPGGPVVLESFFSKD